MTGLGALVRVWSAQEAGHDVVPPVVPAHLIDARWRFHCQCPQPTEAVASAVIRRAKVAPPRQYCPICRTWADGQPLSR